MVHFCVITAVDDLLTDPTQARRCCSLPQLLLDVLGERPPLVPAAAAAAAACATRAQSHCRYKLAGKGVTRRM
jgi:hypothetical protein